MTDNKLLDLGFICCPYTWRNRSEGGFQERLDRALASEGWVQLYPKACFERVRGLGASDHALLALKTSQLWQSGRSGLYLIRDGERNKDVRVW